MNNPVWTRRLAGKCGVVGCTVLFARDSIQAMKYYAAPRDIPTHIPTPRCSRCAPLHGAIYVTPLRGEKRQRFLM